MLKSIRVKKRLIFNFRWRPFLKFESEAKAKLYVLSYTHYIVILRNDQKISTTNYHK